MKTNNSGPPKGYIDAIESKLAIYVILTLDRIGRIETILYSLVEQQKAGPLGSIGMLNDIARDVKQLQTMATGTGAGESPDQAEGLIQGYSTPAGQAGFNPLQSIPMEDRPINPARRYTDSGTIPNLLPGVPRPGAAPRSFGKMESKEPQREYQRRRLHPPTQSISITPQDVETEGESAVDDEEIVQMAGQLSLDENRTVRYHGASSGLNLLTRSKRFDGTFWNLPNPGFWPASDRRTIKTEFEIDSKTQLPPIETQDRLLEYHIIEGVAKYRLYWEHIHPYVPLFYKDHFLRQLARDRQNQYSQIPQNPESIDQYERRIPYVLLFMIFALASRYGVPDAAAEADALTRVWAAGDEYLTQARELLYLYSTLHNRFMIDS